MAINRTLGIAAGAGLASALLFASLAKGLVLAFVIANVTPLPIMIATLGFGQATGLLGAAIACCAIAAVLGIGGAGLFGVVLGFPAWWIGYLALLARPSAPIAGMPPNQRSANVTWYPVGRLVAWGTVLIAAIVLALGAATLVHFGSFDTAVTTIAARMQTRLEGTVRTEPPLAETLPMLVQLMPALLAGWLFVMHMTNLWLAGRVVQRSGLLSRPWPALPENLRLPRPLAAVLFAGCAAATLGGMVGTAAGVLIAPIFLAFALQGLGAAHALTRGMAARHLILLSIYFATFFVAPSLLALAVLGLIDCLLPLRRKQPPVGKTLNS